MQPKTPKRKSPIHEHIKTELVTTPTFYYPYAKCLLQGYSIANKFTTNVRPIKAQYGLNSFSRVKNPLWRSQIASGIDASTPYSFSQHTSCRGMSGQSKTIVNDGLFSTSQFNNNLPGGALGPIILSDTECENIALGKIRSRLANDTKYINLYVPLGELREMRRTIVELGRLTENVVKLLIDIKKGNISSAFKRASELWLLYSFAVNPLVNDINSIRESINARLTNNSKVHTRYRASHTRAYTELKQTTVLPLDSLTNATVSYFVNHSITVNVTAGRSLRNITSANEYGAESQFGLVPSNLIPAFWELVPWSWLIDYVLPMGDFLSDEFSSTGLDTSYCNVSTKHKALLYSVSKLSNNLNYIKANVPTTRSGFWQEAEVCRIDFNRNALVSGKLPSRSVTLKSIDQIGHNGYSKLANIIAVFGSHFASRSHMRL